MRAMSFTGDFEKLLLLIPLVRVAWAEGVMTRRERRIIFEKARSLGIKTKSESYEILSKWIEQHFTDQFYETSLMILRSRWESLQREVKNREYFDLLSNCLQIAEISGGSKKFSLEESLVCAEEFAVIKDINKRLGPFSLG